jgi:class 3 adenylate cyclase
MDNDIIKMLGRSLLKPGGNMRIYVQRYSNAVNLASRICAATPGTQIWIGPETYHQIEDCAECAAPERQTFRGKAEPVAVYRLKSC